MRLLEFLREKVWIEISLRQFEEEWEGSCPSGKTGCGGHGHHVQFSSTYVVEKRDVSEGERKGSHGMAEIRVLCFMWLSL